MGPVYWGVLYHESNPKFPFHPIVDPKINQTFLSKFSGKSREALCAGVYTVYSFIVIYVLFRINRV